MLKPCLILGSGFHRWVLGHPDNPLCRWNSLIDCVSEKLKLPRPPMTLPPVMRRKFRLPHPYLLKGRKPLFSSCFQKAVSLRLCSLPLD